METVERVVRAAGANALRGGDFDGWDLEVPGGIFGSCRVRMAVEEHGAGRQLVRYRSWPRTAPLIPLLLMLLALAAAGAALNRAAIAFAFLAAASLVVGLLLVRQGAAPTAALGFAVQG